MSEDQRGDIGEFIVTMRAEADQIKQYADALQKQAYELSDIGERGATSATLCGIEQALAQISQSAKQIGKDRHNAALVLGMDELIATQHKTLDQFGEEEADKAVKDSKDSVKESGAEVEMRLTSGASPVLAEAKRRLEED
jgi:enolase